MAFMLFSCDNYLDINQNPNQALYSDLVPSELLAAAQSNTFRTQSLAMNQLGNVFSNAWAGNVLQVSGGFSREFNLDVNSSFYNGIWDGLYRGIGNFQGIINYPNPTGKYDYYIAAAKICKAHYMQYIVDLYGNAPYSEAWKYSLNTTPKYDEDEVIYANLIAELESARTLINNADPAISDDIAASDVMLGGDMAKWSSFSNNIELRILLRMSNCTGANATLRDSKLALIAASNDFLVDDVKINPGYNTTNNESQNPYWGNFGIDSSGAATQNFAFLAPTGHYYRALSSFTLFPTSDAGNTKIALKHGTSPTLSTVDYAGVADGRRLRIFRNGASQTALRAVDQGLTSPNVFPPTDVATTKILGRQGFGVFNPFNLKALTGAELSTTDGFVMTKSQISFMLAEAALRGANGQTGFAGFTGGLTNFNEGIDASYAFAFATGAPAYKTAIATKLNYSYTLGTYDQKLHAIMYQKWVALIGIHGIEAYIDYTRTGFPITPLASSAGQPRKPYRLIYPVSEYVSNSANVPAVNESDIYTLNAKTPFWVAP